ncbi:MAG: PA14 domain-containing protein [Gaiellaceae bacterium]
MEELTCAMMRSLARLTRALLALTAAFALALFVVPAAVAAGSGLSATYYDNVDFTAAKLTRTDATVDFNWGYGSPASSIAADTFSVRWSGQIEAQATETYRFYTVSDDGVRLWVDNQLLVNNWTDHATREDSGTIALTAGQKVDVRLEFYERGAAAVARLLWSSPIQPKQVVPQARLYPVPAGTGLPATYYDELNFTSEKLTRTDPTVNFGWGWGSPAPAIGSDTFSVRWAGQVEAPTTETYRFYTVSDDGVRLWVDNQLLVNNWTDHATTENSGAIVLTAGQKVDVRLEFYERSGAAVARLLWSSGTQPKQVVPPARLFAPAPPPSTDPVIAAVGDMACDPTSPNYNGGAGTATNCRHRYTSDLAVNANLAAVIAVGDTQYESGSISQYTASYEPTWGRVKAITRPAIGNHEYVTPGAAGYFEYFGAAAGDPAKGYYSYDIGSWHLIALNSMCHLVGGCGAGSPQELWLRSDLLAHPAKCTVAYWHHPRWSSGAHGSGTAVQGLWQALYDGGADLVLAGHDHLYERFARQNAFGALDLTNGIRAFVVGTGGKSLYGSPSRQPNSEALEHKTYGILKLTLHPEAYTWEFVPEAGKTFSDGGTTACH